MRKRSAPPFARCGAAADSGTLLVVDKDGDTVLVQTDSEILLIAYDSNDAFNIGQKPARYSDFEDDLTVGDTFEYLINDTRSSTINSFTLTNR